MMLWLAPSLTKKVEITEATIQAAPMASGYSITSDRLVAPMKKMDARTIVATTVTA